ncbi:adenylate/guanylate cyclase domain-containing protein [Mycobacterium sp. 852002-51961_SCH5331710]|uniref:ATP-binding protein n=1 Tax=Mycobacterium sp. 852002-51961_SCH5331710 TaxID=1834105 RepID=UPI0007FCB5DB|nr:adenylate/guanylate cyclase domain-containing protein [Mycobacterium sp. 852002-51961_SCH5331710]OBB36440.1 cyclase [Mycobacterium sp. 852002-51961_SCH5331710]
MDVPARCPTCATEARVGARFCDGCGTRLDQPHVAEYKQVTVLFADVVRSMDIAAALGPERLRELMTELVLLATTVIRHYDGTVNQFTGDGIMALFGAPRALEDHARHACLAALDIQEQVRALAAETARRYNIALQLRIGLNSGLVVAGDIGPEALAYTAVGEHVGMAQRMESVAPPGGVMLSESTSRLMENVAQLSDPQPLHIKGSTEPVMARRLLAVGKHRRTGQRTTPLVGRQREMLLIETALDEALRGRGRVIGIEGAPGIGKSRIAQEAVARATQRGLDIVSTYCESHTSKIPFFAAAELLRSFFGVDGLEPAEAAVRIRTKVPEANREDLDLMHDLLGIVDHGAGSGIDPDARGRRLIGLLHAALMARTEPAVYVIDDAQWIDAVSESMLAELFSAVPKTPALVLITYRPHYHGELSGAGSSAVITDMVSLSPLDRSRTSALLTELLGSDPSVAQIADRIAHRSAGNPFFVEEIVRDLSERGILDGRRGAYTYHGEGDVSVPPTVQATIAARIDRLGAAAKRTLNAAAVIGFRFRDRLLNALDVSEVAELVDAELIEPVSPSDYTFRHPLIRAVAYESQLKSSRSHLHRLVAAAIENQDPSSVDKNAALIATHLEAANDLPEAFGWHMRAGNWLRLRDIGAARMSWVLARQVADRLPADDPDRSTIRIAPRTWLCATVWRVGGSLDDVKFDELRRLTDAVGDKRSLAMGMIGQVQMLNFHGEFREASRLASEYASTLDSIGDPELTVAFLVTPIIAKWNAGEISEAIRLSQRAIDLADGDPTMGSLVIGSPLAFMLALRGSARCCLGIAGWRDDFDRAITIARSVDPFTFCVVVQFKYIAVLNWALLADDVALRDTAEAMEIATRGADDFTLANAEFAHGLVLVRRGGTDREHGFDLLERAARLAREHRYTIIAAWCRDLDVAAEMNRTMEYQSAVELAERVLEEELGSGERINVGWSTTVLVEALLGRACSGDLDRAQEAVDRLAAIPAEPGFVYQELPVMRLRALLAEARGDDEAYRAFRDSYRTRAESTGMEGHIAIAREMD